jgi:GABA permease
MRRNVVEEIEHAASGIPVRHVTVEREPGEQTNVLVLANRTVLSDELLARVRKRAAQGKAGFLIVAPQGDDEDHEDADRRLRRALTELRSEGINAHGQIVHPDPYTAAMHVLTDEAIDEIIVSTFPGERSGWLRRDLVQRLRKDTKLPVDHVVSAVPQPETVSA